MRIVGDVLLVGTNDHLLLNHICAWHVDKAYGMNDTVVQYGYKVRRFKGTELNELLRKHFLPSPLEHYQKLSNEARELVEA